MNRAEKAGNVGALAEEFGRATVAVLAEYRGLTAGQMTRLRRAVRDADGRCRVGKNTLARRAITTTRYEALGTLLKGPLAVLLGFEDPVALVKVATKLAAEFPKLEIKGAVLDGQVIPAAGVRALADLPPREVVLGQLLGLLQAPATRLVRTLNEPAAQLARLVDALAKRAGGGPATDA
ncbi:MAG: 50S ribosomal protein L10 [Candidatus Binatia bacterium]